MKELTRKLFIILTALILAMNLSVCLASAEETDGSIIVLYTNDVHCATESYAILAAYRAQLISEGNTVFTVDAGDAIQGEMIGSLTEGSAIVEIMNAVGYDYAIPGNHEFDYTVPTFLSLVDAAEYQYLCSNFVDLVNDKALLPSYAIVEAGDTSIAFIGIATPETYSKSTPTYFQDENGNFIYGFMEDELYVTVQAAVDSARADGADVVVAIGHLGITGTTEGWRSTDVIANTDGIDAFIDAHAHETIESAAYPNASDASVTLSSTGTKLNFIGQMTISDEGIKTELIDPDTINVDALSAEAKQAYDGVKSIVDGYNAEFEYLFEEIGSSEVELTIYDENGVRLVRSGETNAADFVTDAYRAVLQTDVAFVNGGGVRATVPKGVFTRKAIMDINPWNNEMCILKVTGQQLVDALEYGTFASPNEYGSFPHVSGITYELHRYIDSSVVIDELDNFISLDENAPRRVRNVKINGTPIDLDAEYTLAGSCYMLQLSGYTMFKDAEVLVSPEELPTDTEVLVQYVTDHLDGKILDTSYGNIRGDGRVTVYDSAPTDEPVVPGDESNATILLLLAVASIASAIKLSKVK